MDKPAGFRPFRDGMRPAVARFVRSSPGRPAAPFARSSTRTILQHPASKSGLVVPFPAYGFALWFRIMKT